MVGQGDKARSFRPRWPWTIGWGLSVAIPLTFLVSIAACIFTARNDLQQQLIVLTDNVNAVLRIQQGAGTLLRILASYLAWSLLSDICWLLLGRGLSPRETILILDLAVIGDSYIKSLQALWTTLRRRNALTFLVVGLLSAIAVAADLVGVALVASTTVSTYSRIVTKNVTWTYTDANPTGGLDTLKSVFVSGGTYPYIIEAPNGTLALLPLLEETVPSNYDGPAIVSDFKMICTDVYVTGSVEYRDSYTFALLGNVSIPEKDFISRWPVQTMSVNLSAEYGPVPSVEYRALYNLSNAFVIGWKFEFDLEVPFVDPNIGASLSTLLLLTFKSITFDFETNLTAESSDRNLKNRSSGSISTESYGSTDWNLKACAQKTRLGSGLVIATSIEQVPSFDRWGCHRNRSCPQIPIYPAKNATMSFYDEDHMSKTMGVQSYYDNLDFVTELSSSFESGVVFCTGCSGNNVAGTLISDYITSTDPEDAMRLLRVHLAALQYRALLLTADGQLPTKYTIETPAVIITAPEFVYVPCALFSAVAVAAVLARMKTIWATGVDRKGSVLAGAAVVAEGPLEGIVQTGSMKRQEDLLHEADTLDAETLRLEVVRRKVRFVGYEADVGSNGQ